MLAVRSASGDAATDGTNATIWAAWLRTIRW